MKRMLIAVLLLVGAISAPMPGFAADEHHPAASPQSAAKAAPKMGGADMDSGQMPSGMMGGGMMGGGMMGGGTMGGGMMNSAMMACAAVGGHMDGYVAFLKAELKIKPDQEQVWRDYAETLRGKMTAMMGTQNRMTAAKTNLPEQFEKREHMLSERLEHLRAMKAATLKLYGELDSEQKKVADELMSCPMEMGR